MSKIHNTILNLPKFNKIINNINSEKKYFLINGISGSQKNYVINSLITNSSKKALIITYNELQARDIYNELVTYNSLNVFIFNNKEILFYDIEAHSLEMEHRRIDIMSKLIEDAQPLVVVASIDSLLKMLVPSNIFKENIIKIRNGDNLNMDTVANKLVISGYERVDMVEGKGQFSIRGGILDVFSINSENPYRIEFFDDEVDSIREFSTVSQRSIEKKESINIYPAKEIILDNDRKNKLLQVIDKKIKEIEKEPNRGKLVNNMIADKEKIINQRYFPSLDKYISIIYNDFEKAQCSILSYISDSTVILFDELNKINEQANVKREEFNEFFKLLLKKNMVINSMYDINIELNEFIEKTKSNTIINIQNFKTENSFINYNYSLSLYSKTLNSFHRFNMLLDDIKRWKKDNYKIVIAVSNKTKADKMSEFLLENNLISNHVKDFDEEIITGVNIIIGSFKNGFEFPNAKFALVCDDEKRVTRHKKRKKVKEFTGSKIDTFTDLNVGEYVVHESHGIGMYEGLEKVVVENVVKDYVKIKYQGDDYLYVPVNQLNIIQKYIGSDGKRPKINKLGSNEWKKTKSKVKKSVKELAIKLNELYAVRNNIKGFAFSKDNVWQTQFEESFPYEETSDQLRCIKEVKKDMQSTKPMDRLLCGDVGFGKTEVAIRAAFKAVMDQKQVAYLVPTTILAQQHYNTFTERMNDFPINIDMLSRFKTKKEQKDIVNKLKTGEIDIIIATHRLLQKDIKFKDLGLLIVDEEQRFGVAHKETLKNMAKNIDVLSLTATPIPRTLHMSMIGIRDMSLITDPPEGRHPVQTYVVEYNENIVIDAVTREMARNGQVFYLYNRVRYIDRKAAKLKKLIPDARIEIAHGQMNERTLEDIMIKVLNNEIDILVCTTIIESGLDIPNVNTLIIENSEMMGLSQLYQLRGRVGRGNRIAYAYLMYQKDKVLDSSTEKRLNAIKEFTEFGSGFKIAMRDLEIRGAGNILGPEQHGHMEAVGYDTYCRLLDEAVKEIKGEELVERTETVVDINIDAHIPDSFIPDIKQRFEIYKKISLIDDIEEYYNVQEEIEDRYGDLPNEVSSLLDIALIKSYASNLNIESIKQKKSNIEILFNSLCNDMIGKIFEVIDRFKERITFTASTKPYIIYKCDEVDNNKVLYNIKIILQCIKEIKF